jgi:hypothetical protein
MKFILYLTKDYETCVGEVPTGKTVEQFCQEHKASDVRARRIQSPSRSRPPLPPAWSVYQQRAMRLHQNCGRAQFRIPKSEVDSRETGRSADFRRNTE